MNRAQLRSIIRTNLDDASITYYSDAEVNDSLQDAYNEIVAKAQFIIKSSTLAWVGEYSYYDFVGLGVTDYLGTIAIFNDNTNQWLRDDVSMRDFDRIRRDWETWNGQPQFWAPHSLRRIAVAPKLTSASGTFRLLYWAIAPTLASDLDSPLVANDMQRLFEYYCTADLLETAEETTKATPFWQAFLSSLEKYKVRAKNVAKADLLLRL